MTLAAIFESCNATNSADFLAAKFIPRQGATLRFSVAATILASTDVKLTLEVRNGNGILLPAFDESVSLSAVGTGSLQVVSESAFQGGRKELTVRYTKTLTAGSYELISLRANTPSGVTGASDGIIVLPPGFTLTVPANATPTQAFNVTISARAADGGVNTAYNGTVKLSIENAVGTLTPASLTLNNGSVTTSLTFTGTPNAKFHIVATDQSIAAMTSTSSDICMGCGVNLNSGNDRFLNPVAVPVSATQLRLSWNKVPDAVTYTVYRKDSGSFVQKGSAITNTYFNDTTVSTATAYDYQVDAIGSGSAVIASAQTTGTATGCVTNVTVDITAPTIWTAASSPVCVTGARNISGTGNLEIQPGVVVLMQTSAKLIAAAGYIKAVGSPTQPIIITSAATGDPTASRWGDADAGIVLSTGATPTQFSMDGNYTYQQYSTFQYTIVEYARRAINANNRGIDVEYTVLRHNRILDGGINGVALNCGTDNTASNVVRNSVFNNNISTIGGATSAVYFRHNGGTSHAMLVENSVFTGNAVDREGAGLYFYVLNSAGGALTKAQVTGNYFNQNSCTGCNMGVNGGAGMYLNLSQNMTYLVKGNSFIGNSATVAGANGGGLSVNVGGLSSPIVRIEENYFAQNQANSQGGALAISNIYNTNTGHLLRYNRFTGNSATNGGALALNLTTYAGKNITIQQNTFSDNTATIAGGSIYLAGGSNGNTFSRNYFSANYSPSVSFNGIVRDNDNGNTNTWTGNSFVISGLTTVLFSNADTTAYSIGANWWGQTVTSGTACDTIVPAGICSTTAAGNPTFAAQLTSAPALCSASPSDPNCVGAP